MVPAEFHDFFLGAAGVAGALIGLLFVAVSVKPEQLDETEHVHIRARPYTALSAFLNALLLSLMALLPIYNLGSGSAILGIIGLVTMVSVITVIIRDCRKTGANIHIRTLLSIAGQGAIYAQQLITGIELIKNPHDSSAIGIQAAILILLFALGIDRAWQLIGGFSARRTRTPAHHQRSSR